MPIYPPPKYAQWGGLQQAKLFLATYLLVTYNQRLFKVTCLWESDQEKPVIPEKNGHIYLTSTLCSYQLAFELLVLPFIDM